MRLWSLHPKYLDSKGLVALWRESLLAKNVLEGKTRGYINHPQLTRFKESDYPIDCINQYMESIYEESLKRGYNFNRKKIDSDPENCKITVTDKQIEYELQHLLKKLLERSESDYISLLSQTIIAPNPLFNVIKGVIEIWEIIKK